MTQQNDPSERPDMNPQLVGVIIFAALAPLYATFVYFDRWNLGLVFVCITGVFLAAIYVKRSSAFRWRFAAEVLSLYLLHVFVILVIPLPKEIPGFVMIGISFLDAFLVIILLEFFEKLEKSPKE